MFDNNSAGRQKLQTVQLLQPILLFSALLNQMEQIFLNAWLDYFQCMELFCALLLINPIFSNLGNCRKFKLAPWHYHQVHPQLGKPIKSFSVGLPHCWKTLHVINVKKHCTSNSQQQKSKMVAGTHVLILTDLCIWIWK